VRRDRGSRIEIDKEIVRVSKGFRAVTRHCGKIGWEEVEVSSERVIDRRTLVGKHYVGMTIRSVRVEEGDEVEGKGKGEGETSVKVIEYLDVAFI
jgi:hypothetical protein